LQRYYAQDIDCHLEVSWKSTKLLVVIDSEQFNGWQQLHDSYLNGIRIDMRWGSSNPNASDSPLGAQ
jgi:hypothetical protein